MSTIRAATFANIAGTGSPDVIAGEFVRARCNFDGTGPTAIRDSFGVSSLLDGGTGVFTIVVTTAFPNANYSTIATAFMLTIGSAFVSMRPASTIDAPMITSLASAPNTPADINMVNIALFGDKP